MTTVNFSKMIGRFLWFVAATFPWNRKILLLICFNDKNAPSYNYKIHNWRQKTRYYINYNQDNWNSTLTTLGKTRAIFCFPWEFKLAGFYRTCGWVFVKQRQLTWPLCLIATAVRINETMLNRSNKETGMLTAYVRAGRDSWHPSSFL